MSSIKYICTAGLVRYNHMKINICMMCKLKTKRHYVLKQAQGN